MIGKHSATELHLMPEIWTLTSGILLLQIKDY